MSKKNNRREEKEEKFWAIRPDDYLRALMKLAQDATGKDRSDLIRSCIREELPAVVRKIIERQLKARKSLERRGGDASKP